MKIYYFWWESKLVVVVCKVDILANHQFWDKFTVVNRATEDRLTNTISENQKRWIFKSKRSIYG
jgi:hypothetical protein